MRVAVIGWGSLVRDEAYIHVNDWHTGGPVIAIEFSRVSRDGRLTLVVDPDNGTYTETWFAQSRRALVEDAIDDLYIRERCTSPRCIGFVRGDTGASRCRSDPTLSGRVNAWCVQNGFDAAIWTDLPSNFLERTGTPFSLGNAARYLERLDSDTLDLAREYIMKAPTTVQTPLRGHLHSLLGWN